MVWEFTPVSIVGIIPTPRSTGSGRSIGPYDHLDVPLFESAMVGRTVEVIADADGGPRSPPRPLVVHTRGPLDSIGRADVLAAHSTASVDDGASPDGDQLDPLLENSESTPNSGRPGSSRSPLDTKERRSGPRTGNTSHESSTPPIEKSLRPPAEEPTPRRTSGGGWSGTSKRWSGCW